MRAVRLHQFGPAENLVLDEVPDPWPGSDQVRIRVRAAGVHVLDTVIRSGASGGLFPLPELPTIPGREVAGLVDEIGADVDPSWLGRRVVAHLGQASGGYAQLAVASRSALHTIPDGLDDAEAVAMIGTGRTAFAILEAAAITAADVVLVTGASGGLGVLLVQLAHHAGATVVGVAGGPRKVAIVAQQGADLAVDYSDDGWGEEVRRRLGEREVSVVLQAVGGDLGLGAVALLGDKGRVVVYGWSGGDGPVGLTDEQQARGIVEIDDLGRRIMSRPGGMRDLEDAALAAAASGEVIPLVGQVFPLADAASAHRAVDSRATIGKTVLRP
jgi:NADPH2:quinone reductase